MYGRRRVYRVSSRVSRSRARVRYPPRRIPQQVSRSRSIRRRVR